MSHLNEDQRTQVAQLLDRRTAELQDAAGRLRESFSTPSGEAGPEVRDTAEDGQARMQSTLDLVQLSRDEIELREVLAARDRLQDGRYGLCEECEEPIPFARLQARPEARLCIQHEEARERASPDQGRVLT